MTITELIAKLEAIKAEHGDLQVLTPGFDECDLDLVATLEISHARKKRSAASHSGDYEEWSSWRHGDVPEKTFKKCLVLSF